MRAWAIDRYGDNTQLKLRDFPKPQPADDEVLVELKAASINPVDYKMRSGELKLVLHYDFPLIMGNDGAGVIVDMGKHVSRFRIGDEVYLRPHKERIGTLAEFICARESAVALKPANITFEEAASLPLVGLTCLQALEPLLKKGQRVFIPAGSGGVGTFAVQLAKALGAYVITNTSTKNIEFVKSLGADEVIDYTKTDFSEVVDKVDYVFDTMGGETQAKAFKILKRGGLQISIVGPPTASYAKESGAGTLIWLGAGVLGFPSQLRAWRHGVRYGFMFMQPSGEGLAKIAALVEEGKIKPVLDQIFPFSQGDLAMARVEGGHARGKVVVKI
jgi:NADPH:quinone reductase-like Zn-dependent oxidoreductase